MEKIYDRNEMMRFKTLKDFKRHIAVPLHVFIEEFDRDYDLFFDKKPFRIVGEDCDYNKNGQMWWKKEINKY